MFKLAEFAIPDIEGTSRGQLQLGLQNHATGPPRVPCAPCFASCSCLPESSALFQETGPGLVSNILASFDVPPGFTLASRSKSGDGAVFSGPAGATLLVGGIETSVFPNFAESTCRRAPLGAERSAGAG